MTRRRRRKSPSTQEGQAQPQSQPQQPRPKGGGGGQFPKGKQPAPSGGGGMRRDSRSSQEGSRSGPERAGTVKPGIGKPAAGKPGAPKAGAAKGKQPPQRRSESPEVMAVKLIRTFPPKASEIPEYLKTCRAVQPAIVAGKITQPGPEELFYFIVSCIETLGEERIDRIFDNGYRAPLQEMRTAAGLEENEFFKPGDPRRSEAYDNLLNEFRSKKWEILATLFRDNGQPETAVLVVEDHLEYKRQRDEGRQLFIARDPLDPFVAQVISGEIDHPEDDDEDDGEGEVEEAL